MEYDEELLDIVNEKNEKIGVATRGEAHKKGFIHRALSVLIINSRKEILLQQRSANRSVHPLSWDLSTSEHVLEGESYVEAAERSTREELGVDLTVEEVTDDSLQKRQYQLKEQIVYENEIVKMLLGTHEGPFNLNPGEVNQVKFFSIEEIEEMIMKGIKFTPWFLDEWKNVKEIIKELE